MARDTVTPTTTEDTAEAVVVKHFKTALILNAYGPGFAAVKYDSPDDTDFSSKCLKALITADQVIDMSSFKCF